MREGRECGVGDVMYIGMNISNMIYDMIVFDDLMMCEIFFIKPYEQRKSDLQKGINPLAPPAIALWRRRQ